MPDMTSHSIEVTANSFALVDNDTERLQSEPSFRQFPEVADETGLRLKDLQQMPDSSTAQFSQSKRIRDGFEDSSPRKKMKQNRFNVERQHRVAALEARLRRIWGQHDGTRSQPSSTRSLACAVERLLHTVESYDAANSSGQGKRLPCTGLSSSAVIDGGLNVLFDRLIQRRLRKAEEAGDKNLALQKILGTAKYTELGKILQEIRSVQLSTAARGCGGGSCRRIRKGNNTFELPQALPNEVKEMFFGVRLLSALKGTPIDKLALENWQAMMEEAQEILVRYRRWQASQKDPLAIA